MRIDPDHNRMLPPGDGRWAMIKALRTLGADMGPIGVQEMMAIFLIALLLFGPKKLPELGRTLGKALTEFRRAKNELKNTFETHMAELERETRAESQPKYVPSPTPTYTYDNSYTNPYDENGRIEAPVETAVSAPAPPPAIEGAVPRSNGYHSVPSSSSRPEEGEHSA
jgi:sec-independent protein translocase protein TatA